MRKINYFLIFLFGQEFYFFINESSNNYFCLRQFQRNKLEFYKLKLANFINNFINSFINNLINHLTNYFINQFKNHFKNKIL